MEALDLKFHKNQGFPAEIAGSKHSQSGSAIMIIFLLVALLAALAFAITQGTRTGQSNLSKQQADLLASDILNYANALRTATRNLQIKGCVFGEGGISFASERFENPEYYEVPNSFEDNSCDIFHGNGGGVSWQAPPPELQDIGTTEYIIAGNIGIDGIGSNVGDNSSDDMATDLTLRAIVPKEVCLAINRKIGAPNPDKNPPVYLGGLSSRLPPDSTQVYGASNMVAGGEGFRDDYFIGTETKALELSGLATGCYLNDADDKYEFYSLLAAR
ncbi:MAG: hypothetical protein AAF244_00310 [Pseudomonadota bacterium]